MAVKRTISVTPDVAAHNTAPDARPLHSELSLTRLHVMRAGYLLMGLGLALHP